ncbi:MAG: RNA polymerase sporulation sigma factor SigH [Ruminococcaceae bacterium]|nr:RNA polymerase sporulation sigma factor SigH [Oscillospiraceae bacterium]
MLDFIKKIEYNGNIILHTGGFFVPNTPDKNTLCEFDGIPEEKIVCLAKDGDDRATEYIINKYMDFVRMKFRSYFLVGADREDVLQEGMIGLYKAIRDFDKEKKVLFKTFAELCITRHIITAVKSSTRKKHIPLNGYVSLDRPETDYTYFESTNFWREQKELDPEQIMIEKENVKGMKGKINDNLSPFEAQVLMYHLNGYPYSKIAGLMHRDPKSVDNALQRIKRKLEKFLSNS